MYKNCKCAILFVLGLLQPYAKIEFINTLQVIVKL